MPTDELSSLSLGRAYIDMISESIVSLSGGELISALERLDAVYNEFPELELDRPRGAVLQSLRFAAESMPNRAGIPLLMYCAAANPFSSSSLASLVEKIIKSEYRPLLATVLRSLCASREFCRHAIEPVIIVLLRQPDRTVVLPLILELLDCTKFTNEESASEAGDILKPLLSDQDRPGIDSAALARAARSARRRLARSALTRNEPGSRAVLLAMAERLGSTAPACLTPQAELAWSSARMSFAEFLLQWPCEVELPGDLDDAMFIDEAYRAILLRGPDGAEKNQYLRLLHDGVASKSWIIEDLLASEELRSLERRLRVICDGQVIIEPGSSGEEDMPAVAWPWRSASA
jgi:hypothetical protein